jgi:plastocyanin
MRNRAIFAVAGLVAALAVVPAAAQKGKGTITLTSSANPVVFSQPLTLSGTIKGAKSAAGVTLQRRGLTSTTWRDAATATTTASGDFTFVTRPRRSIVYRVATQGTAPTYSNEITQQVSPLVGFKASDLTPSAGARVRFSGTVRPPHDTRRVQIQRKQADGSWLTVARARLRDAGKVYSRYSRRVKVNETGTYRVLLPAHPDHADGVSRERTLTVG